MRIKALLVLTTLAATALPALMPASAQSGYRTRSCGEAQRENQVGGAILGGLIGGVLGSNVAASGHRGDGTAVGAVLGGLVGQGIGKDSTRCGQTYQPGYGSGAGFGAVPGTYNPNYGGPRYDDYGYQPAPAGVYPYDAGDSAYRYSGRDNSSNRYRPDLYPPDRSSYNRDDDYAGSDCSDATQVTRMPDGSEIHRPIEVCRDAYYGDWRVKD